MSSKIKAKAVNRKGWAESFVSRVVTAWLSLKFSSIRSLTSDGQPNQYIEVGLGYPSSTYGQT